MVLLNQIWVNLITFVFLLIFSTISIATSINSNNIDQTKIYYGFVDNFNTVAEINYRNIVENTNSYKEIQNKKIQEGTGKYWILMSEASDKAINIINNYAIKNNYDLILESDYFKEISTDNTQIVNITQNVINFMNEEN